MTEDGGSDNPLFFCFYVFSLLSRSDIFFTFRGLFSVKLVNELVNASQLRLLKTGKFLRGEIARSRLLLFERTAREQKL